MTNEDKLNVCYNCPHYSDDGTETSFEGSPNTALCALMGNTLVRGFILQDCPDGRWK
jgi:hypothetical protein